MAEKKRKTNEWIVLDGKLQSNTSELVELAKTIQGVTVERKGDKIWVKFPAPKPQTRKTVFQFIKHKTNTIYQSGQPERNDRNSSHYCAIMIK